jgi:hypothetical protein
MVERRAQSFWAGGGSDSPAVAPYAFVGRKAEQDGPRSIAFMKLAPEQVTNSGIIWRGVTESDSRRVDACHRPPTSE